YDRVALQPPHEQADVRDARAAGAPVRRRVTTPPAQVGRIRNGVERRAHPLECAGPAQVDRRVWLRAAVAQTWRGGDQPAQLHRARIPAGRITGDVLERLGRAFAASVGDRLGDQ